jgi:hypothetical protein
MVMKLEGVILTVGGSRQNLEYKPPARYGQIRVLSLFEILQRHFTTTSPNSEMPIAQCHSSNSPQCA